MKHLPLAFIKHLGASCSLHLLEEQVLALNPWRGNSIARVTLRYTLCFSVSKSHLLSTR